MQNPKKTFIKVLPTRKSSLKQLNYNPNSLLFNNRLTKSYFSLHDTSLTNRMVKNINKNNYNNSKQVFRIKNAKSKLLERYQSQKKQQDKSDYHNITETNIPKINLKKDSSKNLQSDIKRTKSVNLSRNNTNKFKLLFREPLTRKTVSQRKIQRLDRKISQLSLHNKYLTSLYPPKQTQIIQYKPIPKQIRIDLERITKMVRLLIRNISLYFNMYTHAKKVGDVLKAVDGYNKFFHHMIFINQTQAKHIQKQQQLTQYFWLGRPETHRPQFYVEQDEYLFKILQNYSLKMQRSYTNIRQNFVTRQKNNLQTIKKGITKKLQINQKKLNGNIIIQNSIVMNQIVDFVDNKKRHNQDRRQNTMERLQSLGVKFNIIQRSKQLVLTEKQKIMKNISLIKKQIK